jgi:predicted polyphosphate/ATP-dependent NAD kinase
MGKVQPTYFVSRFEGRLMASVNQKMLGLIVNPVAGLGGKVGLKGSDGLDIQQQARELGAVPEAQDRAAEALRILKKSAGDLEKLVTYPGEMGENAAVRSGFSPTMIGDIHPGETSAEDTQRAAQEMLGLGVDLILFAGGDGTARNICDAVGAAVPAIGIPAGVKIHSAVFGINPASTGELAAQFLNEETEKLRDSEVMDIDEAAYRRGIVSPRLFGYLQVPDHRRLVQARKSPNPVSEDAKLNAIALDVIDNMEKNYYIIGPGTTTRPILTNLGLKKTLIGVDVVFGQKLVIADANEADLLDLLENHTAKVVVTPIGGQGHIFGRGNQQISPKVLRNIGFENIIVISAPEKILSLGGRPLLVDTGDSEIDSGLSQHMKIVTGYGERMVYPVASGVPDETKYE